MSRNILILIATLLVLVSLLFVRNVQTSSGVWETFITSPQTAQPSPSPVPTPETGSDSVFACTADSDCISIRADGCGCNQGGTATAINKQFKEQWEADHPPAMCIQVMSGHWTCKATPKCVASQCKLVEEK